MGYLNEQKGHKTLFFLHGIQFGIPILPYSLSLNTHYVSQNWFHDPYLLGWNLHSLKITSLDSPSWELGDPIPPLCVSLSSVVKYEVEMNDGVSPHCLSETFMIHCQVHDKMSDPMLHIPLLWGVNRRHNLSKRLCVLVFFFFQKMFTKMLYNLLVILYFHIQN